MSGGGKAEMSTGEEFGFASIDHSSDEPLRGHARVDAEGLHWAGDDPSTLPKSVAWRDLLAFHASPPELEDRVMLRLTVARHDPLVLEVLGGGGRKARELLVATKRMLATRLELQHAERQMARAAALRERVTDRDRRCARARVTRASGTLSASGTAADHGVAVGLLVRRRVVAQQAARQRRSQGAARDAQRVLRGRE